MAATDSTAWTQYARCKDLDTEMFYSEVPEIYYQALNECARCPVRIQCLKDALRRGDNWGVRGGTLQRDRRSSDIFLFHCECGALTNRKAKVCRTCYEVRNPKKAIRVPVGV